MPDSFPPFGWGPAPFDERDLDALLSGETADVPDGLRQVADAIAALRAAPTLAELSGEATILAEFSALAEFRALGLSRATRDDGQVHTLVLPAQPAGPAGPAGPASRRGARHRGRRPYPVSRRTGSLLAAAAAALLLAAVAVTGNLPGPLDHLGRGSTAAPAASRTSTGNSGSSGLQVKGATTVPDRSHPTTSSQHSVNAPATESEQSQLCRSFFGFIKHPGRDWPARWKAEEPVLQQLDKLAGSPWAVPHLCDPYVRDLFPHGIPWPFRPGWHLSQDLVQGSQGQQPGPWQPSPAASPAQVASSNTNANTSPGANR